MVLLHVSYISFCLHFQPCKVHLHVSPISFCLHFKLCTQQITVVSTSDYLGNSNWYYYASVTCYFVFVFSALCATNNSRVNIRLPGELQLVLLCVSYIYCLFIFTALYASNNSRVNIRLPRELPLVLLCVSYILLSVCIFSPVCNKYSRVKIRFSRELPWYYYASVTFKFCLYFQPCTQQITIVSTSDYLGNSHDTIMRQLHVLSVVFSALHASKQHRLNIRLPRELPCYYFCVSYINFIFCLLFTLHATHISRVNIRFPRELPLYFSAPVTFLSVCIFSPTCNTLNNSHDNIGLSIGLNPRSAHL